MCSRQQYLERNVEAAGLTSSSKLDTTVCRVHIFKTDNFIILLFQLPEPLLLHSNYEDLIRIALNQQENGADLQTLLKQLHTILEKLPKANRFTLRFIVEHLNRISLNEVWLRKFYTFEFRDVSGECYQNQAQLIYRLTQRFR